ncbi:Purple acid phosphatase 4 [Dichanthelium oligosanthes]|uniref:Purple acid phosphatase n=1 Tax=Dichanthelium oligosanthes TaxID=888268 RepID=A0A1E5VXE5_9POAL|nr:Purple acid phosphatase 4 [Dichanthelium oligosanthes]
MALAALLIAVLALPLSWPARGELAVVEHPVEAGRPLRLLVVGDWGRKGRYNQSRVAEQMGNVAEDMSVDLVVSTGDNFLDDGLASVDDGGSTSRSWMSTRRRAFRSHVLGNHDYRGDVLAQLDPALRNIDSRFICMRSFVVEAGIVDFFFVDTTPFQLKYWTDPGEDHYDWREVAPREAYIENLLKDLDVAMKRSRARWKVAVGHHTMRSVSAHGDTQELLQLLLPVLKEDSVDLYINGHDHCLEHISSRDSPIQYFTSGGGSKAWRGVFQPNADKLEFFYDGQGFMSLEVDGDLARAVFYDIDGQALHNWSLSKSNRQQVDQRPALLVSQE